MDKNSSPYIALLLTPVVVHSFWPYHGKSKFDLCTKTCKLIFPILFLYACLLHFIIPNI